MEADFWLGKWNDGDLHFHQEKTNPDLVNYFPLKKPGSVLVPLCGKTLDMLWLRDQGHDVVGIELSEKACQAFFEENDLPYQEERRENFRVFSAERIELWAGDYFTVTPKILNRRFSGIYDRAALIALPPEMRRTYAQTTKKFFDEGTETLLITLAYQQEKVDGPPFSVQSSEVEVLFGSTCQIQEISRLETDKLPPRFEGIPTERLVFHLRSKL